MYRIDNRLFQLEYGRRDINDRIETTARVFKFENTEIVYNHSQAFLNWRTEKYLKKYRKSGLTSIMYVREELDLLLYDNDGGAYLKDKDDGYVYCDEMILKHNAYDFPCEQIWKDRETTKLIQGKEYYLHEQKTTTVREIIRKSRRI